MGLDLDQLTVEARVKLEGGEMDTKEGRVLSAANAKRVIGAMAALLDTLENAGLDLPGWMKVEAEEDEKRLHAFIQAFKAVSLDAQMTAVRGAFYAWIEQNTSAVTSSEEAPYLWVREIFDTYLVVEDEGRLMAYPYTEDEGRFIFEAPYEVEIIYKPIEPGMKNVEPVAPEPVEEGRDVSNGALQAEPGGAPATPLTREMMRAMWGKMRIEAQLETQH